MMTSQLMTLSSNFKEKNGLHCLARARTNMRNTKETVCHYVYHYYIIVITLVKCLPSLMSAFEIFTYHIPLLVFYHIRKNYKIGLDMKDIGV